MAKIKLTVNEESVAAEDKVGRVVKTETGLFRALHPLFKNGRDIAVGEIVRLEINAGRRFVAAGDAEEVADV